jgi:hypothetical protein
MASDLVALYGSDQPDAGSEMKPTDATVLEWHCFYI